MEKQRMVTRKTWQEFRDTGLLLLVNQFLHIFGWAIVVEVDGDKIVASYPARVRFRGFDNQSCSNAYKKVSKYMSENAAELEAEANED